MLPMAKQVLCKSFLGQKKEVSPHETPGRMYFLGSVSKIVYFLKRRIIHYATLLQVRNTDLKQGPADGLFLTSIVQNALVSSLDLGIPDGSSGWVPLASATLLRSPRGGPSQQGPAAVTQISGSWSIFHIDISQYSGFLSKSDYSVSNRTLQVLQVRRDLAGIPPRSCCSSFRDGWMDGLQGPGA